MSVLEINDGEFEQEVLKSATPVLVDFWAPWCGPRRALVPVIHAFAEEQGSKIKVVKVDVDKNKISAYKYGIRSIPSLFLFRNGAVIAEAVGGMSEVGLSDWVERHIT